VSGAALSAMATLKPEEALTFAKSFEKDSQGDLTNAIVTVYAKSGTDAEWPFVYKELTDADPQKKFDMLKDFIYMTAHVQNPVYAQQGINTIRDMGIRFKPNGFAPQLIEVLNQIKQFRQKMNDGASVKAAEDAVKQINDAK
jgi:aminopeptidase N